MAKGKYQKWLTLDGRTLLEAWARDGLTNEQIAHNMGVTAKTLYAWKNSHGEICEALSRGKEIVDIEVENALFKKTQGYNAQLKKTFKVKRVYYDDEGRRCEEEHLEEGIDEVHIPADTLAQKFWLSNRKPERWRDRPEASTSDADKTNENLLDLANIINHPVPNRKIDDE